MTNLEIRTTRTIVSKQSDWYTTDARLIAWVKKEWVSSSSLSELLDERISVCENKLAKGIWHDALGAEFWKTRLDTLKELRGLLG